MTKIRLRLDPEVRRYLTTLRRVPDDVILAAGTRDFDFGSNTSCLCGWVVREHVARILGVAAEALVEPCPCGSPDCKYQAPAPALMGAASNVSSSDHAARRLFGGTAREWGSIWSGVLDDVRLPAIETAFTIRVMEAVGA